MVLLQHTRKLSIGFGSPSTLCAGITVYASMVRHKMNQHGHMAVKFGKAFGLNVTIFSTSISKEGEALGQLGADNFVVSSDRNQMKALVVSVDFIIEIASGDHPFDPYMELLKLFYISNCMKTISGSVTGGTKDIQEMIDFCASYGIHPMIEIIPIKSANEAIERLLKSVVIYRFVIDIENYLK
ncbi:PREDICTED: probable [Prunus dulcis]|uniref:PREDICTED: probable n=1 Tax=Prunus dulcis TaxID=3755 RepID=A0A5E4EU54_PRUDU|nr:PREDICTED: probable [Prunus dulcis]